MEWLAYPPLTVGFLTAIGWFGRKAYRWGKRVEKLIQFADTELRPNGGSSVKDAVTRIERGLEDLNLRFDEHMKEGSDA